MNLPHTLDQLENAQLVRRTSEAERSYIFKHALTQDMAYDSLLHAQRRELHRHVAHAYESEFGDQRLDDYAGILAKHYDEAGDDEQVLVYATHAGDAAARLYAHPEAIAFYAQALKAAERSHATTAQFTHLYAARGRAYEMTGDYVRAEQNYLEMQALAQAKSDRALELESLMLQATAYAIGAGGLRDPQKAQDYSMQALTLANELDDRPAQARIYWNLLLNNRFGNEGPVKAVEYGEKSLALARELGLTEQIALTLKDLSAAYTLTGQMNLARANNPELVTLWRQLNNTPMMAEVLTSSFAYTFVQGKLDESIQVGEESYRLSQSIGNQYGLSVAAGFVWFAYRERGQLRRAIELVEESIAIGEREEIVGPHWGSLVELAATYDWLGDYARATETAQRALDSTNPNILTHPIFPNSVLAIIALHQGKLEQAAERLAPFSTDSLDEYFFINIAGGLQVFSTLIELALAQKDAKRALAIADQANGLIRERELAILLPSTLHLQAKALRELNRADKAYAVLVDARERAEAMQSIYRLLPILFTLIEMDAGSAERGDAVRAEVKREAREVIDYVAANTPEELRRSFLNLPDVRKVMA